MDRLELYRTSAPAEWAGPPREYSFSSLKRMDTCLRQWQLARSRIGDLAGYPERPAEPAEVGRMVHDLLSRLFQATALAGYPPLDSEPFRAVMKGVDITGTARSALERFAKVAASNPRALGFRVQATPRDVYNKVVAAFREEYESAVAQAALLSPIPASATPGGGSGGAGAEPSTSDTASRRELLERLGVLSEEKVKHPSLPLLGYIDLLVRRDGTTTIIDFKTGKSQPEYQQQLFLYALMWWRSTGDLPARVELRFGADLEGWPVTEEDLVRIEAETKARIARHREGLLLRPASATVGPHCARCHVRQICGEYWTAGLRANPGDPFFDAEVKVRGSISRTGLVGELAGEGEVTVVFDADVGAQWGPFTAGETLRILGATREAEPGTLKVGRAAEVFRAQTSSV